MTATAKRSRRGTVAKPAPTVRVAIYCRQSVADDQEFGSIQAQREAVEAFVQSQRAEGWHSLPEHYDDHGFSGATTDRPAFQRLVADVEAGQVDVIATYKIDRVSRSLADFTGFMELLDRSGVGFVAITQSFDTRTSMGRLTLNILASFSQFERETIAERTRDKMLASRRKGMWTGGRPVLGYDIVDKRLVVNAEEADQVRAIYTAYLEHGSLLATLTELDRRAIRNETIRSKKDQTTPGKPFNKNTLSRLLTNPLYVGRMRCGDEVVDGVHEAIVDQETWDAVQVRLAENRRSGGSETRNKHGVLLKGLVRCGRCGAALGHQSTRRGDRIHHYYVCQTAQKRGAAAFPGRPPASWSRSSSRRCAPSAATRRWSPRRWPPLARRPKPASPS